MASYLSLCSLVIPSLIQFDNYCIVQCVCACACRHACYWMLACVCLVTVATLPMNTFNGTAAHVPVKAVGIIRCWCWHFIHLFWFYFDFWILSQFWHLALFLLVQIDTLLVHWIYHWAVLSTCPLCVGRETCRIFRLKKFEPQPLQNLIVKDFSIVLLLCIAVVLMSPLHDTAAVDGI